MRKNWSLRGRETLQLCRSQMWGRKSWTNFGVRDPHFAIAHQTMSSNIREFSRFYFKHEAFK